MKRLIASLSFLLVAGCGEDASPYTYNQLVRGEGMCNAKADAEALAYTLDGSSAPSEAIKTTLTDCLREKFPELTEGQLRNFHATTERARLDEEGSP